MVIWTSGERQVNYKLSLTLLDVKLVFSKHCSFFYQCPRAIVSVQISWLNFQNHISVPPTCAEDGEGSLLAGHLSLNTAKSMGYTRPDLIHWCPQQPQSAASMIISHQSRRIEGHWERASITFIFYCAETENAKSKVYLFPAIFDHSEFSRDMWLCCLRDHQSSQSGSRRGRGHKGVSTLQYLAFRHWTPWTKYSP